MGKRRADADTRRFFDEFAQVKVGRFRAMGIIDPAKAQAVIPFPNGKQKLIGVHHVHFPNGGSWALFVCPACARRAGKLWLVDDAPRCWKCCNAMNIQHRSKWGFGRQERMLVCDQKLDELIAKLETKTPLRFNGAPKGWLGKAKLVSRSRPLTKAMRRRMISLRLHQIATQSLSGPGVKAYTPTAASKQLIDLKPIYRARTTETLQRALDKAQVTILNALESDNPQQRLNAVKLMMRTKQARERGFYS